MKCLALLAVSLAVSTAFPHIPILLNPGGIGGIYKGPSSETIVKGPDGSVITSEQIGGEVQIKGKANVGAVIPVVEHINEPLVQPIVSPTLVTSDLSDVIGAPVVTKVVSTPIVTGPVVTKVSAPVLLKENPIIVDDKIEHEHVIVGEKVISVPKKVQEDSDLIGPSGTISRRGDDVVVSGPASTTIKGGGVVASIEKQPDVAVKSVEVKPVVAPVILKEKTIATPIVTPVVSHVSPVITPVLSDDSSIIRESASYIAKPVAPVYAHSFNTASAYAPHAPVLKYNGPVITPLRKSGAYANDLLLPNVDYGHLGGLSYGHGTNLGYGGPYPLR